MAGEGTSFWTTIPGILTALTGLIAAVGSLVAAMHKAGLLGKRSGAAEADEDEEEPSPSHGASAVQPESGSKSAPRTFRSAPAVLSSAKVDAMLVRMGLYDRRRNPAGEGIDHRWTPRAIGDDVVVEDGATGLTWQKVASGQPMTRDQASAHVDELNARSFAGFTDWRVPTAEEAMTLMEPEVVDDLHLDPVFPRGGAFLWTADRPPEGGGWVVYYYDGILAVESEAFNAWVRAVR